MRYPSARWAMCTISQARTLCGLDDFAAEEFIILVFCDTCGRSAPLDRSKVSAGTGVQSLRSILRLARCLDADRLYRRRRISSWRGIDAREFGASGLAPFPPRHTSRTRSWIRYPGRFHQVASDVFARRRIPAFALSRSSFLSSHFTFDASRRVTVVMRCTCSIQSTANDDATQHTDSDKKELLF